MQEALGLALGGECRDPSDIGRHTGSSKILPTSSFLRLWLTRASRTCESYQGVTRVFPVEGHMAQRLANSRLNFNAARQYLQAAQSVRRGH